MLGADHAELLAAFDIQIVWNAPCGKPPSPTPPPKSSPP
jgi:hypothetical protein